MPGLFPKSPIIPAANRHVVPACEWVMPAQNRLRRSHFDLYNALPAGKPDCLEVHVVHAREGTERSTAAVYGNRSYLIHYEFRPHKPA